MKFKDYTEVTLDTYDLREALDWYLAAQEIEGKLNDFRIESDGYPGSEKVVVRICR